MKGEGDDDGGFDLEKWPDVLDQLIQVEEEYVSSSSYNHNSNSTQQLYPPPPMPPPPIIPAPPPLASTISTISYSPPRYMSQKFQEKPLKQFDQFSIAPPHCRSDVTVSSPNNTFVAVDAKEQEIDSLKRELGKVSRHLTHLEKECFDLRKQRDKKDEQLTSVLARLEAKDAKVHCRDSTDLVVHDINHDGGAFDFHNQDYPAVPLARKSNNFLDHLVGSQINEGFDLDKDPLKSTPACKAVGVQTEEAAESTNLNIENDLSTNQLSRKLLCVWNSTSDELTGRSLVSKLFVACETDFHVLFGYLNFHSSTKTKVHSLGNSSDVHMQQPSQPLHSAEAAKISCLYSLLTKITNGLVELGVMLEALIDLCRLNNAVIVHRSLHILHVVLNHLLSVKRKPEKRDNVFVEGTKSVNRSAEALDAVIKPFNPGNVFKKGDQKYCCTVSTTEVDWVSLFKLMQQITGRHHEELVRLEAVSIMNIILMRSDAYLERERYVEGVMFQNVSQLLRKESGLHVQKQTVHLVYLLLNCPQVMSMFCSGCKDEMDNAGSVDTRNASTTKQFSRILEGVADCLPCHGNDTLVLQLQRNAVILLAFLVSSGKSGLEILLGLEFRKETNFFALVLKMLVAQIDVEASESIHPSEIFKERTLLIREVLIFLNRLVSNPQYSAPVLRVLTNSRDMAFLTIDVASRLSRKRKWLWQSDTMIRNMRESEIVNLAQIFKRKIFNYLGNNSQSKQN